jgi:hypothetical protein
MNKHTFKMEQAYEGQPATTHEITTDAETIPEVLDAFVLYLRGCGYHVEQDEIQYLRKDSND